MNVEEFRAFCMSFPAATENLQWGDDLCFKIRSKIFAIVGLTSVPQKLCFKCTPETFAELIERDGIRPAPYVGRYKWVMADHLDALAHDELKALIRQSYEMVLANAPKKASSKKPKALQKRTGKRRAVRRRKR